jgi:MFS family permease
VRCTAGSIAAVAREGGGYNRPTLAIALIILLVTLMQVGLRGSRVLTTLFALDLGAGPWVTGVLFALHGLFPCLLAILAGRIADRFDNRQLMLGGVVALAASLTLPYFLPSLTTLYFSVALGGLTSMLYVLATQNLIGLLSTPATRTRNFSYYAIGESSASAVGPMLVGFSIDTYRHVPTYLFLAIYLGAVAIAVAAAYPRLHTTRREPAQSQAPRAMSDLLRLPAMRQALLTNGLVMAGVDLFQLYMPVYTNGIGFSASMIGLVVGAFGVASFFSRLAIPPVTSRWGERRMIAVTLAISAIAFVGIPLTTSPVVLAVIAFALGLGLGCGQPLSMSLAYSAAPKGRTAEAIAMRLAVSYGAHIVIPPVFGAVGTVLGVAPIFWVCSTLLCGGAWINRGPAVRRDRA